MPDPIALLETAGLRVTRPRMQIARMLFEDGLDRHVTAENVFDKLAENGTNMALATVYNTLGHFVAAGLLRRISPSVSSAILFDTNTTPHHHFLNETTGKLSDIPEGAIPFDLLPQPDDGGEIVACELVIRTRSI